jgi:hypothetical protein
LNLGGSFIGVLAERDLVSFERMEQFAGSRGADFMVENCATNFGKHVGKIGKLEERDLALKSVPAIAGRADGSRWPAGRRPLAWK